MLILTHKTTIDMTKTGRNQSLKGALRELLSNYVSGRIPDRRWTWIMEVLDSDILTRAERLDYVTSINRTVPVGL